MNLFYKCCALHNEVYNIIDLTDMIIFPGYSVDSVVQIARLLKSYGNCIQTACMVALPHVV